MAQFNFLATNQELRKGDSLMSQDGNSKAVFQEDGNFVIYRWSPSWQSNTANDEGVRVLLQADNNLVMYTKERKAVWSSVTWNAENSDKMRLTMTNEGHLVLDKDAEAIWTSENSEGQKE